MGIDKTYLYFFSVYFRRLTLSLVPSITTQIKLTNYDTTQINSLRDTDTFALVYQCRRISPPVYRPIIISGYLFNEFSNR